MKACQLFVVGWPLFRWRALHAEVNQATADTKNN